MAEEQKRPDSHSKSSNGDDPPTNVDQAATKIVGWIKDSFTSKGFPENGFPEEYARDIFRFRYGHSIERRLKYWSGDSVTLQQVAELHGSILFAMAKLKRLKVISEEDFLESATLVQQWCKVGLTAVGFAEGQWCEPWP